MNWSIFWNASGLIHFAIMLFSMFSGNGTQGGISAGLCIASIAMARTYDLAEKLNKK